MDLKSKIIFKCHLCNKMFTRKFNLIRHCREVHKLTVLSKDTASNIICPSESCDEKFYWRSDLRQHIEAIHCTKLEVEVKTFSSYTDFEQWKETIEKETKSFYVKHQSVKTLASKEKVIYFYCHRSGIFKSKSTGKRKLKSIGSIKINGCCPSSIEVKSLQDEVQVTYWKTHFGHVCDISSLFLTSKERSDIADKLRQGVTFDRILDDIRDSVPATDLERIHLITKKDFNNISMPEDFEKNCKGRENIISKRAEVAAHWEDFLSKYLFLCCNDVYDEKENPMGYVNLGTGVNNLNIDMVHSKITSNDIYSYNMTLLQYKETYGIKRIRDIFAKMMTEFLDSHAPISADNLLVFSGVTSCIDVLAHCLADPGEVFLVPTPTYGRIKTDLKQRSLVDMWHVPVISKNNSEDHPVLTIEKIMSAYENAVSANRVVRGIILINPNNPLGDIYSSELLMDILSFCHLKMLHVIVDEVYALSVFSKTKKFHSIFKFPSIPDPERTHILYGLSKDFGLAGLRIGVIHTKCEPLKKCLVQLSNFQNVPFPVMEIVAKYLEDIEWCRNYINIHQQCLAKKFDFCINYLKRIGLKVRDSSAAFFLWVDFRHLCGGSYEQERDFFNYLVETEHLFICPGKEFFCAEPGWFRIVFTESHHHLQEGLSRLERAVQAYKPLSL